MNKMHRSVSFDPTKKGPQFQGSQHFRVTTNLKSSDAEYLHPGIHDRSSMQQLLWPFMLKQALETGFQRVIRVAKYVSFSSEKLKLAGSVPDHPTLFYFLH